MTETELEQLSRDVSKKRGCAPYRFIAFSSDKYHQFWLTDDSAFCFELAIAEDIVVTQFKNIKIVEAKKKLNVLGYLEKYADHDGNEILASCVAILRAYLAKGE